MKDRGLRRYIKEVKIRNRVKERNYQYDPNEYWKEDQCAHGKLAKTPKPCSRFCCGNPRKFWGKKTRQELSNEVGIKQV